jgi:hypothetical protein
MKNWSEDVLREKAKNIDLKTLREEAKEDLINLSRTL